MSKSWRKKMKEFFGVKQKTKRVITIKDDTYRRLLELQAQTQIFFHKLLELSLRPFP
jgi:hypothetical protein